MSILGTFERQLAWRYLRPARREGFVSVITAFSVIGIMLGVATLIVVTSLMNGVREEMIRLFIGVDGPVVALTSPLSADDATTLAQKLAALDESIIYALPKISGQLMATSQGKATGVQVIAFAGDDMSHKSVLAPHLPESFNGLMLGERLAQSLRVKAGDTITLISPQGRYSIAGFVPRIKTFTVAGTFKLGMHLYDSSLIVMSYDDALRFFKPPELMDPVVTQFEIGVKRVTQASDIALKLQRELGEDFHVYDWQRSNASLFQALQVQRNVMVIILALIILVAAFNIISSLIMLVQDKRTDIAILRTMGASRGQLIRAFCLSGTLIGALGTLLGVGLGLVAASNLERIKNMVESLTGQEILVEEIYFLSSLPTRTDPSDITLIVISAVLLSFLATIYPARRAASIEPAEALRYG